MNTEELIKNNLAQEPHAEKKPKALKAHGDTRIDNYYWLNERENPEVISYLKSENTYAEGCLAGTEELQEKIYEEIVSRIDPDHSSVPYFKNGYYYIKRYEEGKDYPIYARKKGSLEAEEEIMLDVNEMAEGYDFYQVRGLAVSPDNTWLAYSVDTLSRRIYTIHFKNLQTGETLSETIKNTSGGCAWAADSKTVFFSVKDKETLRPYQIYRYRRGKTDSRTLVYEEKDETFYSYVYKSRTDDYIIIGSNATLTTEYRILPADDPEGEFEVFHKRKRGLEYSISHAEDRWLVLTNMEAENFRLMQCDEGSTVKSKWEDLLPHREDVLLEGVVPFENYLVINRRKDGLSQVLITDKQGENGYLFPAEEEAYMVSTAYNPSYNTAKLRLSYQSMVTVPSTLELDMKSREKKVLKRLKVPGYNPENYRSERLWITARDGVKVPVSLVYHKSYEADGAAPLLLYGYGSYGYSLDPGFSYSRISLLDRGMAYAIAHIRGGEEMGRHWYKSGKLDKKKNTFYDFIDTGKALVDQGYAHEDKLCAMGGSAGGLLMGAVINMAPEMWRAVVAAVPFVDVVTTMLDESIPLTTGEYDEWGNPNEKEYYEYIKSYSPYDNVAAKNYPALLVTTGLHDSQVQYWEPAKWVAKLRELRKNEEPLFLVTNMETGHSGASGRYRVHRETAKEYAFLLSLATAR